MKSKNEGGHYKNLTNFEELLVRCGSLGSRFNPSRPELQLGGLQFLLGEAQMVLQQLTDRLSLKDALTNKRSDLFDKIKPLATSIVNTLIACGASTKTVADAKGFQRKIQGIRLTKTVKETDPPLEEETTPDNGDNPAENGENKPKKTHSSSRQSYELLIEHFSKLLALLLNEPLYNPNEPELQVGTLQNYLQELKMTNTAKITSDAETEAGRRARSRILYDAEISIVPCALLVKAYLKAILGPKSEDYKHVQRIKFKTIR